MEDNPMKIQRDRYVNRMISYMWDGQIKVITGLRRCGKSYLLKTLFKDYLLSRGVRENQILVYELDQVRHIKYRNPLVLASEVRKKVENEEKEFYLFVDEIQESDKVMNPYNPAGNKITFYDALNDLMTLKNLDIYVTGSNSKMLSNEIVTQFRGRNDDIRLHPLSFGEYYSAVGGDIRSAFEDYSFYGGMPLVLSRPDEEAKMAYLKGLFKETYLKDIVDRKNIERVDILDMIVDLLCSSVGSLTNPANIANAINSGQKRSGQNKVADNTVRTYMEYLEDAFLFDECKRYDVKGKRYFQYPNKYYCEDIGLRNARIGFRQQELTHIMENIIYNDLIIRGCAVDVGVVYSGEKNKNGNTVQVAREIDFVANYGGRKTYIQSAFALENDEKKEAELKPFKLTKDSFPKIIIRNDVGKRWYDDNGILNINITDFLTDEEIIKQL